MAAPARRRQSPDERTAQLLDAGERVLVSQGLTATTIADVTRSAGVSKGTFYVYFDSKEELLATMRARYITRLTESICAKSRIGGSATSRLDRFVDALFCFHRDHREIFQILFYQAGFSESDAFGGMRAELVDIIAHGHRSTELLTDVTDPAVTFLLNGINGIVVQSLCFPEDDQAVFRATARDLARRSLGFGRSVSKRTSEGAPTPPHGTGGSRTRVTRLVPTSADRSRG